MTFRYGKSGNSGIMLPDSGKSSTKTPTPSGKSAKGRGALPFYGGLFRGLLMNHHAACGASRMGGDNRTFNLEDKENMRIGI